MNIHLRVFKGEYINKTYTEYNKDELKSKITIEKEINISEIETFLSDKYGVWFTIHLDGVFVGVCGFNHIFGDEANISITLFNGFDNRGIGTIVYNRMLVYAKYSLDLKKITAIILNDNYVSIKFHEKNGFKFMNKDSIYSYYMFYLDDVCLLNKLTVIIPTYNSIDTINQAISSLIDFPKNNLQVIVIDDCSTDGTYGLLKQCKDIELYRNTSNMLPGYSRNIGIEKASGDYIYFLDSDDVCISYWLFKMFVFACVTMDDVVYTNKYLNSSDECIRYIDYNYSGCVSASERRKLFQNQFIIWTALYNKSFLLENTIRFNVGTSYEDNWFSFLIALKSNTLSHYNKIITKHINNNKSFSKNSNHLYDNIDVAYKLFSIYKDSIYYDKYKEEIDLWFYYFCYVQTLRNCYRNRDLKMLESAFLKVKCIENDILNNKYINKHTSKQIEGIMIGFKSFENHLKLIEKEDEYKL